MKCPQDMQDQDFVFFLQNMEKFYEQYGHKFISIKNLNILGVYNSFENALNATLKTEEIGTFLIQECFDDREKLVNNIYGA